MSVYRTRPEVLGGSVEQAFARAVLDEQTEIMESRFARLRMPERSLPRSHLFNRASPRIGICWRPTSADFLLAWIAREALAGPWRVTFESEVLGYAFDQHISWMRVPTRDQLAVLRACGIVM